MSLFLYPVSTSEIEVIKDAPSIYCSYGDMDALQNFKLWMDSITLDDNGCCMDSKQLQYELEDCLFHHNEVIESIKEEYTFDKSYANDLIELFEQYIKLLTFAVDGGYGLRWS